MSPRSERTIGGVHPRRVTLTFDNGPSPDVTPRVLDELASRRLSAWFCVVGSRLTSPEAPALLERMLAEGHRVVNHSLSHEVPLGDEPTPAHARREIAEMDVRLRSALPGWTERWFRPFGRGGRLGPHVFSQAALDELERLGYSVLLWNCVPRDWVDPDGWVETALADIAARDHTVVVLHDIVAAAMEQLPRFLDELQRSDVEITTDVPDDCVPIRAGVPRTDLAHLVNPTA